MRRWHPSVPPGPFGRAAAGRPQRHADVHSVR